MRPWLVSSLAIPGLLALAGCAQPGQADLHGADVRKLDVPSAALGRDLEATVVVPPGEVSGRGVLLFLHGRGADPEDYLTDEMLTALADLGPRAPVLVFPDGGESSYWHDRDDGRWGTYVSEDVVPAVSAALDGGVDPERVAVGGISMGGFGALARARAEPGRWCAVGAHSPAIWRSGGESAGGAFDDAEDFAANDLVAAAREPGAFGDSPIRVDIGREDSFVPGTEALVGALRASGAPVTFREGDGGHETAYWNARWREYLGFYARALERCG